MTDDDLKALESIRIRWDYLAPNVTRAQAHEDVKWLMAAVHRMRAEVDEARKEMARQRREFDQRAERMREEIGAAIARWEMRYSPVEQGK